MTKVIIIGNGYIGSELKKQIEEKNDWTVSYVFSIDNVLDGSNSVIDDLSNWKKYSADIVFLAIPTDGGEKAFEYIEHFAENGVPIVTCEKGALSNYFTKLTGYIDKGLLGFGATVGGGTRMLTYLRDRLKGRKSGSLIGVLNGTLNYTFSKLSSGSKKEDVLKDILDKKYAEPGATTFEAIISGEIGDLHKKGVIVANISNLLEKPLILDGIFQIDDEKLNSAIENPSVHRFLFSISKSRPSGFLCGVEYTQDGWFINMGLFNTEDISGKIVLPSGVNNALYIQEGDSVFSVTGPGAGPEPTANAMILDALDLIQ